MTVPEPVGDRSAGDKSSKTTPSLKFARTLILAFLLFQSPYAFTAPQVEVQGLMPPNAAILTIDGERKLLKVGQTFKGVTLVAAYSRTASLEIDGQQTVLGLSRRVGANYQETTAKTVTIQRNSNLQYMTNASINGRQIPVMVDTGANIVAMNLEQANRLGVKTEGAQRVMVETASDKIGAWKVKLNSVDVGGIRINHVEATVVDGTFPTVILLGMTYLRHVKIEENQGVMTLTQGH